MVSLIYINKDLPANQKRNAIKRIFEVSEKAAELNHSILDYGHKDKQKSCVTICCLKHQKTEHRTVRQYLESKFGLSCCFSLPKGDPNQINPALIKKAENYAFQRKHQISNFKGTRYDNLKFTVYCENHNEKHENISYARYTDKRNIYGINCCSNKSKINTRASNNAKRSRSAQGLSKALSVWSKRVIFESKNDCCIITGLSFGQLSGVKIECHHLYAYNQYPTLSFVPENGVFLLKELHRRYHRFVGGTAGQNVKVTPESFVYFLRCLHDNLFSLKNLLLDIFHSYELITWSRELSSFDILTYKKMDVSETILDNDEVIWLEEPDVIKLISIIQERIELCIAKIEAKKVILDEYLLDSSTIPLKYENKYF